MAEANAQEKKMSVKECFIDRELSWLQFDLRVLAQADDNDIPLLERLNFLSIYHSNMDDFFMVRIGSLMHSKALLPDYRDPKTGEDSDTRLKRILEEVAAQHDRTQDVYHHLYFDLKAAGVEIVDFSRISKLDESMAKKFFAEVRDLLSPRIVDDKHPMQFLGNKQNYLASHLQKGDKRCRGICSLYRVPPYKVVEGDGVRKVFIMSHVVRHFCSALYKKHDVRESCIIRVTRNADVFVEGEVGAYSSDFRAKMERLLAKRKREQPVRLQIDGAVSKQFHNALMKQLGVDSAACFVGTVPFDLGFGRELAGIPGLKYKPRKPVRSIDLRRGEYIDHLLEHDLLLAYPFHSMAPFIDLLYEAADDPRVSSIRITLYRLSSCSKVAMALAYAADRGKDVLCLLELRARFDERNNIDYSEMLVDAGCTVVYGLPDLKVHSKICSIVLQGADGEQRFITQVGTGNYNEVTAEAYTDLSLITADKGIGQDAAAVFDALERGEVPPATEHLLVAPRGFRKQLLGLMREQRALGEAGAITIKCNSMNDQAIMKELIACSQAGVKVELFIRGICCLRPGIPGMTDNIVVKSVVGRYLEHSRIYAFGTGADGNTRRIFMGSGDLLNRNTQRRVEVFVEVTGDGPRADVLEVLDAFRTDHEDGWHMNTDGSYTRLREGDGSRSQEHLARYFMNPAHMVRELPARALTPVLV